MTRLATPVPSIRKSWFGALPPGHTVVTLAARPDLEPAFDEIGRSEWPEFLERDDVVKRFSQTLLERFPEFQLLLLDAMGAPVAAARSAPFAWNGSVSGLPEGWDDFLEVCVSDYESGERASALGAPSVQVDTSRRGRGLTRVMISALRVYAASHGCSWLAVCVRPAHKEAHPLASIHEYAHWKQDAGLPFDPAIRAHVRLGGRIARAAPYSRRIHGTIAEWEAWTGLSFPTSGDYIVPGAGNPLSVRMERGVGVYYDPEVWVVHDLPGSWVKPRVS